MGLLISSFAETTEAAIAVLPIPLLFMILLSGGIKPLEGGGEKVLSLMFPSRWAFETNFLKEAEARIPEMVQAKEDARLLTIQRLLAAGKEIPADIKDPVQAPPPGVCTDPNEFDVALNWFHCPDRFSYGTAMAVLILMIAGLSAGVIGILRKRDIQR